MTARKLLESAETKLKSLGISSAKLDAEIMLAYILKTDRSRLLAHLEKSPTAVDARRFDVLVQKRLRRIPLSQIIHQKQFYGLDFYINKHVLTPRAETEKMVELAIKYTPKNAHLLDVGTGCGAIAIAIAKQRPDLKVTATDVSRLALAIAIKNARLHQVDIKFHESNLLDCIKGEFSAVTANLPYLEDKADLMPEVKHEPRVALLGGNDGLRLYREFFTQLPPHLEQDAYVFTESDPWQQEVLVEEAAKIGLKPIKKEYFITVLGRS
ncbi:MAG TPA: peptide chain release factor N(5)-glutamine methyltransferase [Candidatus Dormibacteraeota bacterium]|nr:peptide chain release factor N(5)-glutamine methyltransferase [Candidatus Dormibacteraeota bacterium]